MKFKVGVLLGSVLVATLALPIGTAGAAGGTVCKTERGMITFSPTLPKAGNPKLVSGAAHWKGTFGGCNNGVSGGSYTAIGKFKKSNCVASLEQKGVTSERITWKSGAGTSTLRFSGTPTEAGGTYTGTVTAGRFKGTKVSLHETWTELLPKGACDTGGLKVIKFEQSSSAHI